MLVQLDTI